MGEQIWIRKRDNGEWILGQIPAANSALVSLNSDNGAIAVSYTHLWQINR